MLLYASVQAVFNDTEEFVLSIDEPTNEVCSLLLYLDEILCCSVSIDKGTKKKMFQFVNMAWLQIVIWDAMTADKVAKWPSNHIGAFRWLAHSPTEAAFVTCGSDRSIRFWKESM